MIFRTGTGRKADWSVDNVVGLWAFNRHWTDRSITAAPRFRSADNLNSLQVIMVGYNGRYLGTDQFAADWTINGLDAWDADLAELEAERSGWAEFVNVHYLILHFPRRLERANGAQIFDTLVPPGRELPSYFSVRTITRWGSAGPPPNNIPVNNWNQFDSAYTSVPKDRAFDLAVFSAAHQDFMHFEDPYPNGVGAIDSLSDWFLRRFRQNTTGVQAGALPPPGNTSFVSGRFSSEQEPLPGGFLTQSGRWLRFPIIDMGNAASGYYY